MEVKRVQKCMREAIWTIQNSVMDTTGTRPTQEVVASALTSFMVLHEISEHIKAMCASSETGG